MIATLTKEFRFEASHVLPKHDGKCKRLHGHSYRVVVEITGPIRRLDGSSGEAMVVDFGHVKEIWNVVGGPLDHQHLNDVLPDPAGIAPTAEAIASYLLMELRDEASQGDVFGEAQISAVTVWETATSSATVRA